MNKTAYSKGVLMNRASLLLLVALSLTGCEQYAKLVDGSSMEQEPVQQSRQPAAAKWTGTVNYVGVDEPVVMSFYGPTSAADGHLLINSFDARPSSFSATISGTYTPNTFNFTLDEGLQCTNKWSFSGTYDASQLTGTFTGLGNPTVGVPTTCYQAPLTMTINLSKAG